MKRAQAAIEFLTTYGWAILIVLIAIGALAYFDVLNPSKFLPDKCMMATGSGLICEDYVVSPGMIVLRIKNVLPQQVKITSASISKNGNSCELGVSLSPISTGNTINLGLSSGPTCLDLAAPGKKLRGRISITFTKDSISKTAKGDITAEAEPVSLTCTNAHKNDLCFALNTLKAEGAVQFNSADCYELYGLCNCGDGVVDKVDGSGEECDDGNYVSGDGCYRCEVEEGYTCSGEPSICT